jgi:hypothetical protein
MVALQADALAGTDAEALHQIPLAGTKCLKPTPGTLHHIAHAIDARWVALV